MLDKKYTKWFSKLTIDTLEKYGNCTIIKLFVGKHALLHTFLRYSFLNVLSDGKWSKELHHRHANKLQHTYIVCQIMYEGQLIKIVLSKEFSFICDNSEDYLHKFNVGEILYELKSFDSDLNITINTLLEQTIKNIGDADFLIWTPWSSCQEFVKNVLITIDSLNYKRLLTNRNLHTIRLYDDNVKNFTIQNIEAIFKEMPVRVKTFVTVYTNYMNRLYNIS